MLACGSRDEVGRHRRFVGERLVEPGFQPWQQLLGVRLRQDSFVMIGPKTLRDLTRKRRLGYLVGVEADREGCYAPARRGRGCDDDARVDAARQKKAER